MAFGYQLFQEIGIRSHTRFVEERYQQGFNHALKGGQLTRVEHLKLSFREGFRAGKLYLREVRRSSGVLDFPLRAKITVRSRI